MILRQALAFAVFLCVPLAPLTSRALDRGPVDVQDRVLDLLLPMDVESKPYFVKIILRFRSDASQLALVVYPGREAELIRSSLNGMNTSDLTQLVSEALAENPRVTDAEIAAKVRVRTTRLPVQYKALEPMLNDLKNIKISPFLSTRVGVDEVRWYEFWFDSGQEYVHYKIFDVATVHDPQDNLARWMTRFRTTCDGFSNPKS